VTAEGPPTRERRRGRPRRQITKALGASKVSKDHACARMVCQWLLTGGNWNVEDHHYAEGLPNSAQTLEFQSLQCTAFRVGRNAGQKAAGVHVAVATETSSAHCQLCADDRHWGTANNPNPVRRQ
jgi:hypothetical protein